MTDASGASHLSPQQGNSEKFCIFGGTRVAVCASADAGQKVKGGFKNDGVSQAVAWAQACITARASKAGREKEKICLENLRAEMQIEGDTYVEEQKRTGKKAKISKEPAAPAQAKIAVSMKDYEIEEEESSEEEEQTLND